MPFNGSQGAACDSIRVESGFSSVGRKRSMSQIKQLKPQLRLRLVLYLHRLLLLGARRRYIIVRFVMLA